MSVTPAGDSSPAGISINDSQRRARRRTRHPGLNYRFRFMSSCSRASAVVIVLAFA